MIIEYDFAQDLLQAIEQELENADKTGVIRTALDFPKVKTDDIERLFDAQNFCLPLFTRDSTEIVQISNYFYEIFFNGIQHKHPELAQDNISEAISDMMGKNRAASLIYTAIYGKINNLVFNYREVLRVTIAEDNLIGIHDEERLLLGHLNKYHQLLQSEEKQIDLLRGIILNKKISDLVLKIYIRFINLRLQILKPQRPENISQNNIKTDFEKFIWKGNQKQLCELFVMLQEKGWIEEIRYGKINKAAKAICSTFDLTLTQKDASTDIENSFYQILKGKIDPDTKKRTYEDIFGMQYEFSFKGIRDLH